MNRTKRGTLLGGATVIAGLSGWMACGGGGGGANPQPTPTLNSTITLKVQNLDNPGSTEYMSGDRAQYTATATVSVSNPNAGMSPATVFSFNYNMYPGQGTDMFLSANNVSTFTDIKVNTVGIVSNPATAALQYTVIINDPTVASKSTTIIGDGDTVTFKSMITNITYDAATIKPKVLANLDTLAQIYAQYGTYLGNPLDFNIMKASLAAQFDGIDNQSNPEATAHVLSFSSNGIAFLQTQNASWQINLPRAQIYAIKKIYDN